MTMREQVLQYVMNTCGVTPDYPWARTPDSAVLRHPHNRKWFALVMPVSRKTLGLSGDGVVDVMNVKCDPLLILHLRQEPGFRPAYHMNKDNWLTVLLDGSCPAQQAFSLIEMSYHLTF